jgi:hypothetical protein
LTSLLSIPGADDLPEVLDNLVLLLVAAVVGVLLPVLWKIMKRVEEQFDAFMSGFNELIPPDLVNVFDERGSELEKTRLLLSIPGADDLPEVLDNLVLLLVAAVS